MPDDRYNPRSDPRAALTCDSTQAAHPFAPAGGPGSGIFSGLVREIVKGGIRIIPVVGPFLAPGVDFVADHQQNLKNVYKAYELAVTQYAGPLILEETGQSLEGILKGIIPELLKAMAIAALATLFGGAVGAALGSLAGGIGAVPGAIAGGEAGFEAAVWYLGLKGIIELAKYVIENLGEVITLVTGGVERAWNAGRCGTPRDVDIKIGAQKMARGVAVLVRLLLEAIVMYLIAKGAGAIGTRAKVVAEKLKKSNLGKDFAAMVENKAQELVDNPKTNPNLRKGSAGGSAAEDASKTGPAKNSAPKTPEKAKTGGAYKDVPAKGGEVHHMPADSVSPLSRDKGPGIRMDTADHRKTASWGSSKEAKAYRAKQQKLIEQGRFREAQQMDINDIRSKFGNKYDEAIGEMMKYTDTLYPSK